MPVQPVAGHGSADISVLAVLPSSKHRKTLVFLKKQTQKTVDSGAWPETGA
jgi:hypothetical protein